MRLLEKAAGGREKLLEAALTCFSARGFDGASIRDIGRRARLTNPALYRHFSGKEALGLELYRLCYASMVEAAEAAAAAHRAPLAKLGAYVAAMGDLYERDPRAMLFVDEHQVRFWPRVRRGFEPRTLSGMVMRWIAVGRRDGSIDKVTSASAQAALVLGAPGQWAAMRAAGVMRAGGQKEMARVVVRALRK